MKELEARFFKGNRERFKAQMQPNSLAVFMAPDLMPKSADQTFTFQQNRDLYYLTGINQEETILILYPDHPDGNFREVLFVRRTNEIIATWEGEKLNQQDASDISGIGTVYWADEFETIFPPLMNHTEHVYLNLNDHDRFTSEVPYKELRFALDLKDRYPLHDYKRAQPIIRKLRAQKQLEEIEIMRKACAITGSALERVLKFVKPGVMEYEIEAEITHEFIRNGAEGHAYHPIIASGKDSCVLHYEKNNKECKDGDILLMDFGSVYHLYASDLTRTIPVNGRFTDRQKAVYNAVLDVMKQAKNLLRPGVILKDYQKQVGELIEGKLIDLQLLDKNDVASQDKENPLYKKYFPHGTSHHIGLDVHDVPSMHQPIETGMVFTVEPGIYIPDEKIGVRIENDILITEDGFVDLMKDIPIEVEEIENIMNS